MADNALTLAAPLLAAVVAVPREDLAACAVCHSGVVAPYPRCFPCNEAFSFLDGDVPQVVPVSLSLDGLQLHHALRQYKDGFDETVRRRFALQLAGLLELFMRDHADCVGRYDVVTCVPSARRVAFEAVVGVMARFQDTYELLLDAVPTLGVRRLVAGRFTVRRSLEGERVLIVDDTFTTGASVFSATAAMRAAGATVETILVVGRHANPGRFQPTAELLERMRTEPLVWDKSECVVCRIASSKLF